MQAWHRRSNVSENTGCVPDRQISLALITSYGGTSSHWSTKLSLTVLRTLLHELRQLLGEMRDTPSILANVRSSMRRRYQACITARGRNLEHLLWWRLLFLECSFSSVSCCATDNKHVFSSYLCPVILVFCVVTTALGKHVRPCIAMWFSIV